jgi:predicted MFS family arabinose efflux permease
VGNLVNGFGHGLSSPLELAYRQAITLDRPKARMNATIRSINRAAVVVGAPLGGLLADSLGYRPALLLCAGGTAAAGLALLASPFRTVR